MKKFILIATGFAVISAYSTIGAYAQATGPAGQDTMTKGENSAGAMSAQPKMSKKKMTKKKMMKKNM